MFKSHMAILFYLFLLSLWACSDQTNHSETSKLRTTPKNNSNVVNQGSNNSTGDTAGDKANGDTGNNQGSNSSNTSNNGTGDNSGSQQQNVSFNAVQYFEDNLLDLLKANCEACHVGPRVEVPQRGPQTIYNVEAMLPLVMDGTSSTDNAFINKVSAKVTHGGGDRCNGSLDNSPCKEIRDWGKGIHGDNGSQAGAAGLLVSASWDGEIIGYAYNTLDTTQNVTVEFYLNAPYDDPTSVNIGEVVANLPGVDGNTPGNHKFQFKKIPDEMIISGQEMKVYGYAIIDGEKKELGGSPFTDVFYVPQDANYFTSTVLPAFNRCSGCHAERTIRNAFSLLVQPKPAAGGTATTNLLYTKAAGTQHGGGNQCGGNVCTIISTWWNNEFNSN